MAGEKSEIVGAERVVLCVVAAAKHLARPGVEDHLIGHVVSPRLFGAFHAEEHHLPDRVVRHVEGKGNRPACDVALLCARGDDVRLRDGFGLFWGNILLGGNAIHTARLILILLKAMMFQPTAHRPDPIHPIALSATTI